MKFHIEPKKAISLYNGKKTQAFGLKEKRNDSESMKILSNSLSSWLQILIRCRHVTSCKFFLFITNSVFDLQSTDFNLWSLNSEIVFLRKIWEMLSSLSRVGLSSSKWGSKAVSFNCWQNLFLKKIWLFFFAFWTYHLTFIIYS